MREVMQRLTLPADPCACNAFLSHYQGCELVVDTSDGMYHGIYTPLENSMFSLRNRIERHYLYFADVRDAFVVGVRPRNGDNNDLIIHANGLRGIAFTSFLEKVEPSLFDGGLYSANA